ncbi:MAG: NUDIX domain-containing protein [Candidatus Anaerobiospirillum merdipullorum]|uniref:NUDIX domain-containing protein n=1 Tax=Candidatus Anaerobiospirillum merdipullorum TaxID=2838450 RepID=A0A9E2NSC8_9GAMM|nr:NUDIX domain-containing protein [Candidatus Anaerobiospirillum merdipullorum]
MSERFKPYATVALIIEHAGRFLMVEELDEYGRKVFGMPSGHIDAKEGILAAALREGHEETGCKLHLTALTGIYDYVKDYETIYRFCFAATLDEVPQTLHAADPDGEILQVAWYSADEIYAHKDKWRTRLVGMCMDDYLAGKRYPLTLITNLKP